MWRELSEVAGLWWRIQQTCPFPEAQGPAGTPCLTEGLFLMRWSPVGGTGPGATPQGTPEGSPADVRSERGACGQEWGLFQAETTTHSDLDAGEILEHQDLEQNQRREESGGVESGGGAGAA